MIAIGLEGSANKIGIGIISHDSEGVPTIMANVRRTYITPPGEGFLPKLTALHHRQWVIPLIKEALANAAIDIIQVDCICFTRGPGMFGPLNALAIVARTLSVMFNIPLVG